MIGKALVSAAANTILLAGIPFLGYVAFHKLKHKNSFKTIRKRAGLQLGKKRYLLYSLGFAAAGSVALVLVPLPTEPFTREGSAQHQFAGLGFTPEAILLALIYG
ncbi:MAG: hypothetical protein AAGF23_18390, partial [Acidobacteriota bacterium]